ncbi:hypothetical protein L9F63_018844, partial [Diploptera punctata]
GYLEVWRSTPDCPLSDKQLADLFNNIEDIYRFNSAFLRELEQCGLDPVAVAQSFVRNNNGFSIYTQYCTNYPRTVSVLTELMRQEATVRLFRERQTALQHTLPLGSYLLKPVQRILKYHLLLQNIVKHYVYEAEGYKDIVDALSAMTGIAHHINNMKRRHEHAVRVQEIQSLLYGWEGEDLTTFGELCAEGAFRMYGAKAMRHAFLFDRMLLITKKKEEGILGYKTHIMCSNLMLIESVPGEPLSFHVIPFDNPRLQYTLQKREWTLQLKRVILENYNAVIPSHARQLVMELGQNRTDVERPSIESEFVFFNILTSYVYFLRKTSFSNEIMADKTTPKRQHSAPEYLEKRKQERDRRKSETGLRYRLRRSRKSDVGTSGGPDTSPVLQRRGRRASSSSRDRSETREDRSTSPHSKIKSSRSEKESLKNNADRFGSWRRKSEPGCYAAGFSGNKKSPKLTIIPFTKSQDIKSENSNNAKEDIHSRERSASLGIDTGIDSECGGKSTRESEIKCDDEAEEIVSQLLMQNREFQKILKKQQRQVSLRSRLTSFNNGTATGVGNKDETTDTENDDEEGVYETLSMATPVPQASRPVPASGQSYRQHRHAHMRALRNEQKSIAAKLQQYDSNQIDPEYVTLMCHNDSVNASKDYSSSIKESVKVSEADPLRGYSESTYLTSASDIMKNKNNDVEGDQNGEKVKRGDSFGNYDNLQHIWENVKKQQEEIRHLAETVEGEGEDIRRQRRFLPPSASQASLDGTNIPTLPAVWLKQQGEHLATPNKKSGSLPRSFQLNHEIHTSRDSNRPFTIASDKPPEINFEDIERYIEESDTCHVRNRFPINAGDTTEDESMTDYTATPNTSLNELNVHPEYKIYRPSVSKATLKHVISSVSNKLAGIRMSSETLESNDGEVEQERILQRERRASKLVYALARQYIQQRTPSPVQTPSTPVLPIYKQGSSSLGARIAHCSSEYANPRQLYPNIATPAETSNKDIRPDSVLSLSSNFTASSSEVSTLAPNPCSYEAMREKVDEVHLSDGSADSYYERSFEAIESFLENDMFRDSAVFSDHEDLSDIPSAFGDSSKYNGNDIPAKPDVLKNKSGSQGSGNKPSIFDKVKSLEEKCRYQKDDHLVRGLESISKSIRDRRRELELWKSSANSSRDDECDTSSQHSTASTVIEVSPCKDSLETPDDSEDSGTPRGWVKHVIGKLQGAKKFISRPMFCRPGELLLTPY